MFEYTDANYFQFGYNQGTFNRRESAADILWCRFGPIRREPNDFRSECLSTARSIREIAPGEIAVCFSGGMDSELCLRSFVSAGIRVRAVSARFTGGLNEHDLLHAYRYCRAMGIPHDCFDLDLEEFWRSRLEEYAAAIYASSPQFPVLMWLCDQIADFPVIGSGDSAIQRRANTNEFYFREQERYLALYQYFIARSRPAVPAFFQYTPELLLSFFEHPAFKVYREGKAKAEKLLSIWKYKFHIYRSSFADLEPREVFNGFEKVPDTEMQYRQGLERLSPGADGELIFNYEQFIRDMRSEGAFARQSP